MNKRISLVLRVGGLLTLVLGLAISGVSLAAVSGRTAAIGHLVSQRSQRDPVGDPEGGTAVISSPELPHKIYLPLTSKRYDPDLSRDWKGLGRATSPSNIDEFNISWWFNWKHNAADFADDQFVPTVWGEQTNPDVVAMLAAQYPGRHWMIFNEPDMREQANIPPAEAATYYDTYYQAIKGADPTAIIGGINLTYVDNNGHTNGPHFQDYLPTFLENLSSPIDFYCIHDWGGGRNPLADGKPTWRNLEKHIEYIRNFEALEGVPIWLTETGGTGEPYSDGKSIEIRENYMKPLLEWLFSEGFALGIERVAWFSTLSGNHPNYDDPPWRSDSLYKDTTWEVSPLGDYWSSVAER